MELTRDELAEVIGAVLEQVTSKQKGTKGMSGRRRANPIPSEDEVHAVGLEAICISEVALAARFGRPQSDINKRTRALEIQGRVYRVTNEFPNMLIFLQNSVEWAAERGRDRNNGFSSEPIKPKVKAIPKSRRSK